MNIVHPNWRKANRPAAAPILRRIPPRIRWSDGSTGMEIGETAESRIGLAPAKPLVVDVPTERLAAAIRELRLAERDTRAVA